MVKIKYTMLCMTFVYDVCIINAVLTSSIHEYLVNKVCSSHLLPEACKGDLKSLP
jgi:hypothetical protein